MNRTKLAHESPPRAICGALITTLTQDTFARQAYLGRCPAPLQDNTLVAGAPGDSLAIQIFKQRDGIFASDAGQLHENRNGDTLALVFLEDGEAVAELGERITMENQVGRHADQDFVAQQDLKDLLRAFGFDRQLTQDLFDCGHRQTCGGERFFDLLLGAGFLSIEIDCGACALNNFALHVELLLGDQGIEGGAKGFGTNALSKTRPQIFARYSRKERVFFVKLFYARINFLLNLVETFLGEEYERLRGDSYHATGSEEILCGGGNLICCPAGAGYDFFEVQSEESAFGHCCEDLGFVAALQRLEESYAASIAHSGAASERVEHYSTANGGYRGKLADDETVTGHDQNIVLKAKLHEGALAGSEFF